MNNADAAIELQRIRSHLIVTKRRVKRSKLDRQKNSLVALRREGGTLRELQEFLRQRSIRAERSTISRWLAKHGA